MTLRIFREGLVDKPDVSSNKVVRQAFYKQRSVKS